MAGLLTAVSCGDDGGNSEGSQARSSDAAEERGTLSPCSYVTQGEAEQILGASLAGPPEDNPSSPGDDVVEDIAKKAGVDEVFLGDCEYRTTQRRLGVSSMELGECAPLAKDRDDSEPVPELGDQAYFDSTLGVLVEAPGKRVCFQVYVQRLPATPPIVLDRAASIAAARTVID